MMESKNLKNVQVINKDFITVSECIIEIIFCSIFFIVLSGNFRFIRNLFNNNVVVKLININAFSNYRLIITIIAIVGIVNALVKIKEKKYNKLVVASETITFLGSLVVVVSIINSETIIGASYHVIRLIIILIIIVEYLSIIKKYKNSHTLT